MAEQTHPGVDGFQINDDGSVDLFLISKQRERKERLKKLFDRVENAKKPVTFSTEGSPGAAGTGFDFVGDVDTPETRTTEPKPEDDDISLLEFLTQVGVGGALDAADQASKLVVSEGQRLRDTTLEDVARNLQGVAASFATPEMQEAGQLQPLPEGAFGKVGKKTVQEALDSLDMGGKIPFAIPQLEKKGGVGTEFARGISSFLYGYTVLRTFGIAPGAGSAGIGSDILTTPGENNLANMFNQLAPELQNPVTDFLEAKIDDSVLTQRLKQAGLGGTLGSALKWAAIGLKKAGITMADLVTPKKAVRKARKAPWKEEQGPLPKSGNIVTVRTGSLKGVDIDLDGFEKYLAKVNSGKAVKESIKDAQDMLEQGRVQPDGRPIRHRVEAVKEARLRVKKDPIGEARRVLKLDPSKKIDDVDPLIMELVFAAHMLRSKELADSLFKQRQFFSGIFKGIHAANMAMAEQRKQLSEAAARVLGIRNAIKGLELEEGIHFGKQVHEELGVLPPGVSEADLIKFYKLLNARQLKKSYDMAARPGMKDFLLKYMYFNLLSGGDTQVANILGNMLGVTFNLTARKVGEQVRGGLRFMGSKEKGLQDGETAALTFGLLNALRRLLPAFWQNIKNTVRGRDIEVSDVTKLEGMGTKPALMNAKTFNQFFPEAIPGERPNFFDTTVNQVGAPIEAPGKFLMSLDHLAQGASFDAAMYAVAFRKATEDGLTGRAAADRIQFYLQNPTVSVIEEATVFARSNVFLDELGPFARNLQKGLDDSAWGRILIPFMKVLVNLAKFPIQNGPLGLFTPKQFNAVFKGTAAQRDIAFGQMITGTAISLAAISWALGGGINGTLGADKSKVAAKRRRNKIPCSFRVYNKDGSVRDIAFNNMAPVGQYFCAAADFVRIAGELKAGEDIALAEEFINSTRKILLNATFAQNIIQIGNALEKGDPQVLENLVSTLIPASNIVADFQRNGVPYYSDGDNKLRDTRTVNPKKFQGKPGGQVAEPFYEGFYRLVNRIRSRIPGLSDDLEPRHNLWGEEIILEGGLGPDIISPIYTSTEVDSPIDDIIDDNDVEVKMPEDNYKGIKLTPSEHQEWIVRAGKPAKKMLEQLYKNGVFDKLSGGPEGGKAQLILTFVNAFRNQAMDQMLLEEKHRDLLKSVTKQNLETYDARITLEHKPLDIEGIMKNFPARN